MSLVDPQTLENIKKKISYEAARQTPPEGFSALPEIPVSRYISEEFFQLEQKHLWNNAWLYAAHKHELPDVGSYK